MRYKVGDRVKIKSLDWYNENKDKFDEVPCKGYTFVKSMVLYCDSILTIENKTEDYYQVKENTFWWTDEMIEGLVEEEKKISIKLTGKAIKNNEMDVSVDEYIIPEGYILKDENGNVINAMKIVLEKKKKEYPKTYEECCKVLNVAVYDFDILYNMLDTAEIIYTNNLDRLLNSFRKLLICRDAYWKIAGEEMGLGKPWEPDYSEESYEQGCPIKYVIYYTGTHITKERKCTPSYVLSFPTEEMRDAFYDNFKEEIESCKELL